VIAVIPHEDVIAFVRPLVARNSSSYVNAAMKAKRICADSVLYEESFTVPAPGSLTFLARSLSLRDMFIAVPRGR
jgi:hypothetical protein